MSCSTIKTEETRPFPPIHHDPHELIEQLAHKHSDLMLKDVDLAVRLILDEMTTTLCKGGRVEVRGFGSFALNYHPPRNGRNPKTGESVMVPAKYAPHFKPGTELRERVDQN